MHGLNRITKIIKAASRQVSNSSNFLTWTQLKNRQLIEIRGQDSASFLQGLITNDIRHLYSNGNSSVHLNCLFSFLLQPNGRVLSDLLIYNLNGADKDQRLLAECDEHSVDLVLKTLKSHKLRRKVDIELNQKWNVFVIYPQSADATAIKEPPPLKTANTEEGFLVRDPRLSLLGFRLLATEFKNPLDVDVQESNLSSYIQHRYKLGVGEGAVDHPPGNCFPLESNADYLHGVSFHKGCYVGQELTARTFHTGVIRKRLMPLLFEEEDTARNIDLDSTLVLPGDSKRIGKMRNKEGKYGLALVNVGEAERNHFNISIKDSNIHVRTWKPSWWPKAATKEEIPSGLPEIVTHVSKKSI